MSGGHFDYKQYAINEIADSIEHELKIQGLVKVKDEFSHDRAYYEEYPNEKYYYTHPKAIQKEFRNAIKVLRKAAIYAQRVDWYLSGDDGEESFLERLKDELNVK